MQEYRIFNDVPSPDLNEFNFDIYSSAISSLITNLDNNPPFTIAVNGTWGSGKTTLMRKIKHEIDSNITQNGSSIKTVWFNAWRYSDTSSLISALSLEIFEQIVSPIYKNRYEKYSDDPLLWIIDRLKRFNLFWKIRPENIIDDFVCLALNNIQQIPGLSLFRESKLNIKNWFYEPIYKGQVTFHDRFQQFLKTIIENYVGQNNANKKPRLVIFIDDLDRCNPKLIAELLEAIYLFFESADCIFVMGLDLLKVVGYIESEYKEFDGFSGFDYIEKMIQLQFSLPCLHDNAKCQYIKSLLPNDCISRDLLSHLGSSIGHNPREIKKFVNIVLFYQSLGESLLKTDFEQEKYIKWLALRFVSEELIRRISNHPELLLKIQYYIDTESVEIKEEIKSNIFERNAKDQHFLEDIRIIKILKSGDKRFEEKDIPNYLYLNQFSSYSQNQQEGITIVLAGDQTYTIGQILKFSGTASQSKKVYLFITGPNLPEDGMNLESKSGRVKNNYIDSFSSAKVNWFSCWEYEFNSKRLEDLLVPGTYTVYCTPFPISKGFLSKNSYDSVSFIFKKPMLSLSVNPSRTHCGKELLIQGYNDKKDKKIALWIFGYGFTHRYEPSINDDGSFEYILRSDITKKFNPGQYFILLHQYIEGGDGDLILENDRIIAKYIDNKEYFIDSQKPIETGSIIITILNNLSTYLSYCKAQFYLKSPTITIISIIHNKNDSQILISGSTNYYEGDKLIAKISPLNTVKWDLHKYYIGEEIFVIQNDYKNKWEVMFDLSEFPWKDEELEFNIFPLNYATYSKEIINREQSDASEDIE